MCQAVSARHQCKWHAETRTRSHRCNESTRLHRRFRGADHIWAKMRARCLDVVDDEDKAPVRGIAR